MPSRAGSGGLAKKEMSNLRMTSIAQKMASERPTNSIWSESQSDGMIDITLSPFLQGSGIAGRILALGLLALCLPIIALLVVIVRSTSKGPGLYKQVRVGKDGKIFVMYKVRSMVVDAEVGTGPVWTQDTKDPRITRIGSFLRKSHLDELPQLVNVVRGEMGLFGPRPERPELVHVLADNVPGYLNRLAVLPGITGLAQINLPPDTDVESVRRKLILDVEYIRKASFWLHIRMFVWTGLRLVAIPSSIATGLLGLSRDVKPVERSMDGPVTISDVIRECEDNQGPEYSSVKPVNNKPAAVKANA